MNLKLIKGNNDMNLSDNVGSLISLNKLVKENKTTEKNKRYIDKNICLKNLTQNNELKTNFQNKENNYIIKKEQNLLNDNNTDTKQKKESKTINSIGKSPNLNINNNFFNDEEIYSIIGNKVNSQESKNKKDIGIQKDFSSQGSEDEMSESVFMKQNFGSLEAGLRSLATYWSSGQSSELSSKRINGNITLIL